MRRAVFIPAFAALHAATLLGTATPLFAQAAPERVPALTLPAQLAESADHDAVRAPSSRAFLGSPVGRTLTGAVIGGWLGYFASHIAASDWDHESGIRSSRAGWALGGVAVGGVAGLFTSFRPAPARGPAQPAGVRPGFAAARGAIESDEIRRSGATNAYELVRSLRKEWLIPRGVNSFTESARGHASLESGLTVVPGADHILVYLNNARLGGTQFLEEVSLEMVDRIEFIPGAQAVFRWGTGHAHGVILLTTLSGER
jgi:hypothetical protein